MSYRIDADETLSEGLKRIAAEQSQKALDRMKAQSVNRDEVIHDARVCFKKNRAVLRLVRGKVDDDIYRQENIYYRDAGRRLSAVRDTAAMIETIDMLCERFADQLAKNAFENLRKEFMKTKRQRQVEKKKALSEVARTIVKAQKRIDDWPLKGNDFSLLGQGLRRVYKQGQIGFAQAYDRADTENFHEWRKEVKYLLYQVRIIKPIWTNVLGGITGELKRLAGYLSDMHDLAVLRQKVLKQPGTISDGREIEVLVALIDQRQDELQRIAKPLGKRIYVEKPKVFIGRLQTYWQAWQSEERANPPGNG